MTQAELLHMFSDASAFELPLPGHGKTALRHLHLFAVAEQDVSLAKLTEAHWDAVAILAEAGRAPKPGALYAVWASEVPGKPLVLSEGLLSGEKAFCTGFGLVQRALVTVGGENSSLLDVDVRPSSCVVKSSSTWHTQAFSFTNTGAVLFRQCPVEADDVVGDPGFYTNRPGFWHGACGPAACWAGSVSGLLAAVNASSRRDPHTLAHLGAIHANVWAMRSLLQITGEEIDADPQHRQLAQRRALLLRHSVEQLASDTLQRFARAYGPYPLSMQEGTARRYQEAELFLRQCHGERDLESLARLL